jgi:hypothetical protein
MLTRRFPVIPIRAALATRRREMETQSGSVAAAGALPRSA